MLETNTLVLATLARRAGQVELYSGFVIEFFGGGDVELAEGDFVGVLVPNGERVSVDEVVADLLVGPMVFENQGHDWLGSCVGDGLRRSVIGTVR